MNLAPCTLNNCRSIGVRLHAKVNISRFKDRLLSSCPDLTAVPHGRDVLLTFNEHLGATLKHMNAYSDNDAVKMVQTVQLVRAEIFSSEYIFDGTFNDSFSKASVPPTLLALISMLLEGPGLNDTSDSSAALSIAQLIIFNAVKRQRKPFTPVGELQTANTVIRHPRTQEIALPVYLGMMIHSATRNKKIVEKCCRIGLSVSYDRVLQLTNKIANSVCAMYRQNDMVCPPKPQDRAIYSRCS